MEDESAGPVLVQQVAVTIKVQIVIDSHFRFRISGWARYNDEMSCHTSVLERTNHVEKECLKAKGAHAVRGYTTIKQKIGSSRCNRKAEANAMPRAAEKGEDVAPCTGDGLHLFR